MVKKQRIYLFRHGQTFYNKNKIFTGWKDSKLTKEGFKNAKQIAKKLKSMEFEVAFHTSLSRSKQTLNVVLKNHPECVQIIEDDRMIERTYGDLEGKKHSTIIKKYGKEKYDCWHRGFNCKPPKGESFADVEKRVRSFIKDLKKFMKKIK